MYYTEGFKDEEGEEFILKVFNLLNGVVNPNTLVHGVRFYDKLEEVPLGFVVLQGPKGFGDHPCSEDTNYILVGSHNIRDFIASFGRDNAYMYFIDFIVHELYHTTQNIDLPRYVSDEDYNDMIETDCEYHSALFISNYIGWIQSRLNLPFEVNFTLSEKFLALLKEEKDIITTDMINDPWVINI